MKLARRKSPSLPWRGRQLPGLARDDAACRRRVSVDGATRFTELGQYVATQWLNRMGGQRLRRHRRPPKFCGHAAGETGRARTTDAVGAVAVVGAHACPAAGSGRLDRRIVARAADRPTAAGAPRPGTGVPTD